MTPEEQNGAIRAYFKSGLGKGTNAAVPAWVVGEGPPPRGHPPQAKARRPPELDVPLDPLPELPAPPPAQRLRSSRSRSTVREILRRPRRRSWIDAHFGRAVYWYAFAGAVLLAKIFEACNRS